MISGLDLSSINEKTGSSPSFFYPKWSLDLVRIELRCFAFLLGSTTGTTGPLQPYFMPIELVSTQLDPAGMKLTFSAPVAAGRGGFGGARLGWIVSTRSFCEFGVGGRANARGVAEVCSVMGSSD